MAYKFQLGAFKASGSIEALEGFDANSQAIVSASSVATDALATDQGSEILAYNSIRLDSSNAVQFGSANVAISQNSNDVQLEVPTSNRISFVNGASTSFEINSTALTASTDLLMNSTSKALFGHANAAVGGNGSGALQLESDGAATIQLVVGADSRIVADSVGLELSGAVATNSTLTVNGLLTGNNGISLNDASGIAGDALANNGGSLDVQVDDSSIETTGGSLQVKASGITNGMLSGSIENAKLANSDVTIGSTAVALGSTVTSFSGLTGLDFTASPASIGASIGANNLTLGGSTSNVVVAGNLTVQGSTTTVDSTTINISSSFTFEGPVDAHQTTLDAGTPVADTTVYLPELSAGTYYIPAFDADPAGTSLSVTPAELNLLDGGTSVGSSITIADTDGFIVNDNGTMKSIPASDIKDYASAAVALSVASKADGDTLATGMNYFAALSADANVTLPASPSVGDLIYVKASSFSNNAGIIVSGAGSQTIDGEGAILLESDYAAVTLVYVASNDWRIV